METDRSEMAEEQCRNINRCKLIYEKASVAPGLVSKIKKQYCLNPDHQHCARFHVFQALGLDEVPSLMLPNQKEWAQQVIEETELKKAPKPESVKST